MCSLTFNVEQLCCSTSAHVSRCCSCNMQCSTVVHHVLACVLRGNRSSSSQPKEKPVNLDRTLVYTGVSNMFGYACRGNVFEVPTPAQAAPVQGFAMKGFGLPPDAGRALLGWFRGDPATPTYLGFTAQGTGQCKCMAACGTYAISYIL
jgi:hypothetical protein